MEQLLSLNRKLLTLDWQVIQDIDGRLEKRLGRLHARLRLGIEADHEAQVFGQGINYFHIENLPPSHIAIRSCLKLTGLYGRGRKNAAQIELRRHDVISPRIPKAFDGFVILQLSDLHIEMSEAAMTRLAAMLPDIDYDLAGGHHARAGHRGWQCRPGARLWHRPGSVLCARAAGANRPTLARGYVFTSDSRERPDARRKSFHASIARLGERAGMPFPIHPHMLRHACGFALANAGHDTRALQAWLGHRNIQHTVRYTELAPDRFKDFWRD